MKGPQKRLGLLPARDQNVYQLYHYDRPCIMTFELSVWWIAGVRKKYW